MYITIFLLFCLLLCSIISQRKDYQGLFSFDKIITLPLRGVLALLIIAHHIGQKTDFYILSNFTSELGPEVVSVFFFITGYGLSFSYISKGNIYFNGFLHNRLGKLLPKFIILTLCMMLLYYYHNGSDFPQQINNLVLKGITPLPHSWFIYAIIYVYVSFYICGQFVKNTINLGVLFTLFILMYIIIVAKILHYPSFWFITIICVNIGFFTATFEKSITKIIEKNKILSYSSVIFLLIGSYILVKSFGGILIPVLTSIQAFSVYLIIRTIKFFQWNWLRQLGILSLEIYLVHGIPLKVGEYLGLSSGLLWLFTYLSSILCAIILNRIFGIFSRNKLLYKLRLR